MLERDGESRLQLQLKEESLCSKQEALKKDLSAFAQQFKDVLKEVPKDADGLVSKLNAAIKGRRDGMEHARAKLSSHQQKFSVTEAQCMAYGKILPDP